MSAVILLAQMLALRAAPTPVPSPAPALLSPVVVLQRFALALRKIGEPPIMTVDYTLDQTGSRTLAQTHRVFRGGNNERDETLSVDGRPLSPPKIRIFLGRRNRYSVGALAPRVTDYNFIFVGSRKNAHHNDYVFRLAPKATRPFNITGVVIDGVRFLPSSIAFATSKNSGSGIISFARSAAWWVPYFASARAIVGNTTAAERLSFYTYRFPPSLPPSTFSQRRSRPIAPRPRVLPTPAPSLLP